MQADGIKSQCHLSICAGILTIHCSTLDRSTRLAIYNSEGSVFALLHDAGSRQLQEGIRTEGVEGPEQVVAELHLLLTSTDRRELEAEQDTPEHRIGIRVRAYGSDEEVVEAEERETSAPVLRDQSVRNRDKTEDSPIECKSSNSSGIREGAGRCRTRFCIRPAIQTVAFVRAPGRCGDVMNVGENRTFENRGRQPFDTKIDDCTDVGDIYICCGSGQR